MSEKKVTDDEANVLFVGGSISPAGTVVLHKDSLEELTAKFGDVKGSWKNITSQLSEMIASTSLGIEKKIGYYMDEIEVSLGFNGKGKVAFIAEAGAEASIKIKLKKSP